MNDILDTIRVASPCPIEWDEMDGDDQVRFCAKCSKRVFDISRMTRSDARELILGAQASGKRACVRMFQREDGTLITGDCPVGKRSSRRKLLLVASTAAAAMIGLATQLVGLSQSIENGARTERPNWRNGRPGIFVPPPGSYTEIRGEVCIDPIAVPENTPPAPSDPEQPDEKQ